MRISLEDIANDVMGIVKNGKPTPQENTKSVEEINMLSREQRDMIESFGMLYESYLEETATYDGGGSFWCSDRVRELETKLVTSIQQSNEKYLDRFIEWFAKEDIFYYDNNGVMWDRVVEKFKQQENK